MKKFMQEFKDFAMRGNVMDMAVGVVIGAAFKGIVDSLVNDLLNPLLGLFGSRDLSGYELVLGGAAFRVGQFYHHGLCHFPDRQGHESAPHADLAQGG